MQEPQSPWERVHTTELKSGGETVAETGATVLDYWKWAYSDLLSNTSRGVLAEFLVARSIGDDRPVRDGWAPYDLEIPSPDGSGVIRVEVKSGSFQQSWKQTGPSKLSFGRLRSYGWDYRTNEWEDEPGFHADVYVFAVNVCLDPDKLDVLAAKQWDLRVLPRRTIEDLGYKSIGWGTVKRLAPTRIAWENLRCAVLEAANLR